MHHVLYLPVHLFFWNINAMPKSSHEIMNQPVMPGSMTGRRGTSSQQLQATASGLE